MQNCAVLFNLDAETPEGAIRALCGELVSLGLVKETLADAAVERERNYPTGLPTGVIQIAIPHADAVHVNKSSWAAARLAHPVEWRSMEDPDELLDVEFVMLLATDDPKQQLSFLRKLTRVFQDEAILEQLRDAKCERDIELALECLNN